MRCSFCWLQKAVQAQVDRLTPLSYELELFALAVLLYLYDSTVLLYANEALLIRAGPKRWIAESGWQGLRIAGRTLYILNPLTPLRPSFRLHWSYHSLQAPPAAVQLWPECVTALRALGPFVVIAGIALFILLPVGLFTAAGSYALIPALIALYGSTLSALLFLYRSRVMLPLSRMRLVGIAFECLICPPLAVNMIRRITLAIAVNESLPIAAIRLLSREEWARLREICIQRLDDAIQSSAEGSSETATFEAQKQRLRDMD
jgi:hypothetical protein